MDDYNLIIRDKENYKSRENVMECEGNEYCEEKEYSCVINFYYDYLSNIKLIINLDNYYDYDYKNKNTEDIVKDLIDYITFYNRNNDKIIETIYGNNIILLCSLYKLDIIQIENNIIIDLPFSFFSNNNILNLCNLNNNTFRFKIQYKYNWVDHNSIFKIGYYKNLNNNIITNKYIPYFKTETTTITCSNGFNKGIIKSDNEIKLLYIITEANITSANIKINNETSLFFERYELLYNSKKIFNKDENVYTFIFGSPNNIISYDNTKLPYGKLQLELNINNTNMVYSIDIFTLNKSVIKIYDGQIKFLTKISSIIIEKIVDIDQCPICNVSKDIYRHFTCNEKHYLCVECSDKHENCYYKCNTSLSNTLLKIK